MSQDEPVVKLYGFTFDGPDAVVIKRLTPEELDEVGREAVNYETHGPRRFSGWAGMGTGSPATPRSGRAGESASDVPDSMGRPSSDHPYWPLHWNHLVRSATPPHAASRKRNPFCPSEDFHGARMGSGATLAGIK